MKSRHLFLFGGSPPFNRKLGQQFANYSFNGKGKVGILFIEREGWREYMPKYTSVLEEFGLHNFSYIALSENPSEETVKELRKCTGIIICGGDTVRFRQYIVDTILSKHIGEMYKEGVPLAGFSAGALVIPEQCVISPKDNQDNELLFQKGLGILKDCVIAVHFSQWNEEENVRESIERTNVSIGYGIDEGAGMYFHNETLTETEGCIAIIETE